MRTLILALLLLPAVTLINKGSPVRECSNKVEAKPVDTYLVTATVMTSKTGGQFLANGKKNDANSRIFVALPDRSALGRSVSIFCPETEKTVTAIPVCDVGPHSTGDAYWEHGKTPLAEQGKSDKYGVAKNNAGIDLSLKLCKALSLKYPYKGQIVWWFDDDHTTMKFALNL